MIPDGITGIILAGGESRRMGAPKPLVPYRGKPLIGWIFEALRPLCSRMVIVANGGDFSDFDATVVPDNFPGHGPAGGIEAGLRLCGGGTALISSCDSPNLSAELFRYLLDKHPPFDITIAAHDGISEPLTGVFEGRCHRVFLESVLAGDPHPPRIIRKCNWQMVNVDTRHDFYRPDLFLNLNSPSDLNL